MHVEISDFLIWLAAGALGWGVRAFREVLEWRRAKRRARGILADPHHTNDPETALELALLEGRSQRIRKLSTTITPLNGTGPHKKI